ncbi:MAG: hypothetical protein V9F00_17605 [Nocardioides sp.]
MAVSLGVETLAAARGVKPPRLPGLGLPQGFAARLVAVAALLFAVAPTVAPVFAPQAAHAAPVARGLSARQSAGDRIVAPRRRR